MNLPSSSNGNLPLNRLSWLRSSHSFLNSLILSPSSLFCLFCEGRPLVEIHEQNEPRNLAFLSIQDARPFLGSDPFFGQLPNDSGTAPDRVPALGASRLRGPTVVFLGLREPPGGGASALPLSDFRDPEAGVAAMEGNAIFCIDVTESEIHLINNMFSELAKAGCTLAFVDPRAAIETLEDCSSGIIASARSLIDWNHRNKFCPACGSPSYSLWGGWKRQCSSLLPGARKRGREPCLTSRGLHNLCYPRTDPVVITLVVDETGEKVLLGRKRGKHINWYSTIAGFVEPGETLEDAVKREVWEEAGVKVWNVKHHTTEPWPFPANLMIGFYATADSSQPIRTDLDKELEDARWFTRNEIAPAIRKSDAHHSRISNRGSARKDTRTVVPKPVPEPKVDSQTQEIKATPLRLPGPRNMAGVLIRNWVEARAVIKL